MDHVDSTTGIVVYRGAVLHGGSFPRNGLVLRSDFVLSGRPILRGGFVLRGGCVLDRGICGHLFDGDDFLGRRRAGDTIRVGAAIRADNVYVVHTGSYKA